MYAWQFGSRFIGLLVACLGLFFCLFGVAWLVGWFEFGKLPGCSGIDLVGRRILMQMMDGGWKVMVDERMQTPERVVVRDDAGSKCLGREVPGTQSRPLLKYPD